MDGDAIPTQQARAHDAYERGVRRLAEVWTPLLHCVQRDGSSLTVCLWRGQLSVIARTDGNGLHDQAFRAHHASRRGGCARRAAEARPNQTMVCQPDGDQQGGARQPRLGAVLQELKQTTGSDNVVSRVGIACQVRQCPLAGWWRDGSSKVPWGGFSDSCSCEV